MSNIQQTIDDYINNANNNISASASSFINNLEEIKKIASPADIAVLNQQLAKIDEAYEKILEIYRPSIRQYVNKNIRVIYANDRLQGAH